MKGMEEEVLELLRRRIRRSEYLSLSDSSSVSGRMGFVVGGLGSGLLGGWRGL